MEGVGDEAKAVGPHPVEQLHKRKGEVETEKEEEITGGWVLEDGSVYVCVCVHVRVCV